MTFVSSFKETCPLCHRLVTMQSEIEAHPSNPKLALQNFSCPECGPVRTRIHSLALPERGEDDPKSR
jgi:C4-type Zn-finger protein